MGCDEGGMVCYHMLGWSSREVTPDAIFLGGGCVEESEMSDRGPSQVTGLRCARQRCCISSYETRDCMGLDGFEVVDMRLLQDSSSTIEIPPFAKEFYR